MSTVRDPSVHPVTPNVQEGRSEHLKVDSQSLASSVSLLIGTYIKFCTHARRPSLLLSGTRTSVAKLAYAITKQIETQASPCQAARAGAFQA